MKRLRIGYPTAAWVVLWIVLAGCIASKPSQPARFYMLSPTDESKAAPRTEFGEGSVAFGIGPVEIPEYLNRAQIVTRVSSNELKLAEFDRWAEPLNDNFSRVLAENLSTLLGADPVAFIPWRGAGSVDYKVEVEVIRLDGDLGKDVTLIVRWTITRGEGRELLLVRRSEYVEPVRADNYEAVVAAKSRTIAAFSQNIADEIRKIMVK